MSTVRQDRGHAARVGRHDRESAGERFDDRLRHVVEVGGLDVDVVIRVDRRDGVGIDASEEADVLEPEADGQAAKRGFVASRADHGQRGLGMPSLNLLKRPQRAGHVVRITEVSRRQEPWPQGSALAEREPVEVNGVRHDGRRQTEVCEHVGEIERRHHVAFDARQRRPCDPGASQVVGRLAAVVVEDDGPPEQPTHQDGGQRGEQKRPVGRREHVHDVGASDLTHELRHVRQFGHRRPDVFDLESGAKATRGRGVDRHQPRLDVRVVAPRREQALRLDGVAAEDLQGRRDDGDA